MDKPSRKRARKGHANPDGWIIKKNQKLREQGEPFLSYHNTSIFHSMLINFETFINLIMLKV